MYVLFALAAPVRQRGSPPLLARWWQGLRDSPQHSIRGPPF